MKLYGEHSQPDYSRNFPRIITKQKSLSLSLQFKSDSTPLKSSVRWLESSSFAHFTCQAVKLPIVRTFHCPILGVSLFLRWKIKKIPSPVYFCNPSLSLSLSILLLNSKRQSLCTPASSIYIYPRAPLKRRIWKADSLMRKARARAPAYIPHCSIYSGSDIFCHVAKARRGSKKKK